MDLPTAMKSLSLFSEFECAMVMVGQQTGRLPEVMRTLAVWYEQRHRMRQKLMVGLIYPMLVYHMAGPLLALISVVSQSRTLSGALVFLAVWTAIPWVLFALWQIFRSALVHSYLVSRLIQVIPLLRTLLYRLESSMFFESLGMCLEAGWPPVVAIRQAAATCSNYWYRRRYLLLAEIVDKTGCPISEALKQTGTHNEVRSSLITMLETGEQAGKLPEYCQKFAKMQLESAEGMMSAVSRLAPALLYGILVVYLAIRIISFFSSYIGGIQQLL